MASTDRYRPTAGAAQRDAHPEEEPSSADVERIVREVRSSAGRPSLGAPGVKSPTMNVRMPAELRTRVSTLAKERKIPPSEVVRTAVAEYLAKQ